MPELLASWGTSGKLPPSTGSTRVQRDHGRINVVFADAGISQSAPIGAIEEEHFDCAFGKNVKGLVFTLEEALMVAGGTIILTGSGAGSNGFPNLSI